MLRRHAFTLIELLVVIAIIAILAAILFPVFAQAKMAAKKSSDLSNLKQISLGAHLYGADNDDTLILGGYPSGTFDAQGRSVRWYNLMLPYTTTTKIYDSPLARRFTGYDADPRYRRYADYGISYWWAAVATQCCNIPLTSIPDVSFTSIFTTAGDTRTSIVTTQDPLRFKDHWYRPTDYTFTMPTNRFGEATTSAGVYFYKQPQSVYLRRPIPMDDNGLNVAFMDGHAKYMQYRAFFGPLDPDAPVGWPYGHPKNHWDNQ
ncbi:MAG: prepilin-type N-terminal cleavage/methylation domain-containing protein [Fimbriimonadaceae bacterium]|jgi:prepilin-type N-terminal cleavage/methylation domain-containing protein/prepilin-type processing-associated H-X9-DG protein|nr:prepilin-type N-terminal cleavage/methylation domain-containing protein [Fimbriimonadaceae bacterium]